MSGQPNSEGIRDLIDALDSLDGSEHQARLIEEQITAKRLELSHHHAMIHNCRERVKKGLEAMDVAAEGNHGHEHRLRALLVEMRRQVRKS